MDAQGERNNTMLVLALIELGIGLIEKLAPQIADLVKTGMITVEQQQALHDRIQKLRTGEAFQGSHWKVAP